MQKATKIGISALLTLGLLAGCGNKTADTSSTASTPNAGTKNESNEKTVTKPVPITFMVWGDDSFTKKYVEAVFKAYPELNGKYEIQTQVGGKGDADVAQRIRVSLAANDTMPDIVELNRSQLTEFAKAGILEDLTPEYKPVEGNLLEGAKQLVTIDNKYYAFPYELKTKQWFYRKDMFDQAGIDVTKIKNLDDFIEAGKKLHEKFPKSYITNMGTEIPAYWIGMLLSGNGAKFTDEQGNFVVSKDSGIRKAFEATYQLKQSGVVANINDWTPDWEKGFADGTIASSLTGDWFKQFLPNYAKDQAGKWAVAQFPIIADSVGGSEAGGSIYVIPAKAPHKKEAIDFLSKAILTKQGNLALHEGRGLTPVLKDAIADPSVQKADVFFGESLPKAESEALAAMKVFQFDPSSDLEFKILNQYLSKYTMKAAGLDDALKSAESDMKNQIGNPLKN